MRRTNSLRKSGKPRILQGGQAERESHPDFVRRLPPGIHPVFGREYRAGRNLRQIGDRYGISPQAVCHNLQILGVPRRGREAARALRFSQKEKLLWEKSCREGLSLREILALPGITASKGQIARHLKKRGFSPPLFPYYTKAREAYLLRLKEGLTWPVIAARLGYATGTSALAAARSHAIERKGWEPLPWPVSRRQK